MIFAGHPDLHDRRPARRAAGCRLRRGRDVSSAATRWRLSPLTQRIAYLNDGEWAVVSRDGAAFFDADGAEVDARDQVVTAISAAAVGKSNYRHFMEKELHEHPAAIGDTLRQ